MGCHAYTHKKCTCHHFFLSQVGADSFKAFCYSWLKFVNNNMTIFGNAALKKKKKKSQKWLKWISKQKLKSDIFTNPWLSAEQVFGHFTVF